MTSMSCRICALPAYTKGDEGYKVAHWHGGSYVSACQAASHEEGEGEGEYSTWEFVVELRFAWTADPSAQFGLLPLGLKI